MPSRERVKELVRFVEQGRILDAVEEFYADDVRMQDNLQPPTVGKAANRERERGFVESIRELHRSRANAVLVDGDRAAIHWHLEFTSVEGVRLRFDQIALQTWRDGRIVAERFFYDSAALVVEPSAPERAAAGAR